MRELRCRRLLRRRRRLSPPPDRTEEKKRYYQANIEAIRARTSLHYQKRAATVTGHLARRLKFVKGRAKKHNLAFTLTLEDLLERLDRIGGRCEKTGTPFVADPGRPSPWQVSIDRIDPAGGYTPDNVQLVVLIYNMAKNEYSDADVLRFAQELLANSR